MGPRRIQDASSNVESTKNQFLTLNLSIMALYNAGYLSPIRKKLGNAVGRKWRTLNVLAVYQPNVSNPNSEAQQIVRWRFGTAAKMAMHAAGVLGLGLRDYCTGRVAPPRSAFIGMNWPNFGVDHEISYEDLQFSAGSLDAPVPDGAPGVSTPLTVSQHMNTSFVASLTCNSHDLVYMVVYDKILDRFFLSDAATRSSDELTITLPSVCGSHRVHVYTFAVGAKATNTEGKTSPTVYIGNPTVTAA